VEGNRFTQSGLEKEEILLNSELGFFKAQRAFVGEKREHTEWAGSPCAGPGLCHPEVCLLSSCEMR
jgi:hypothetical protein